MRKATESATKWLTEKVRSNPKLNPIPCPFFKSIISKQVEWARTQRKIILNFEELAEAVSAELLKAGIYVMAENSAKKEIKPERESNLEFVCNGCSVIDREIDKKNCPLYNVTVRKLERADACMFMCAFYHYTLKSQIFAPENKEAQ